ncbi:NAD(P)(+) transhydrogenase (Re/Si-specific) subunit beta [Cupriavidus basilensis]
MCKAMNRTLSVILGGFGATQAKGAATEQGDAARKSSEECAPCSRTRTKVIIVPGHGMAVAQRREPSARSRDGCGRSINVRFESFNSVAGRLPGHMNVLLAEARVPQGDIAEMEEINDDFEHADVVLVVGANDTVNPGPSKTPPVPSPACQCSKSEGAHRGGLQAQHGRRVCGRRQPLFYKDNTADVVRRCQGQRRCSAAPTQLIPA